MRVNLFKNRVILSCLIQAVNHSTRFTSKLSTLKHAQGPADLPNAITRPTQRPKETSPETARYRGLVSVLNNTPPDLNMEL